MRKSKEIELRRAFAVLINSFSALSEQYYADYTKDVAKKIFAVPTPSRNELMQIRKKLSDAFAPHPDGVNDFYFPADASVPPNRNQEYGQALAKHISGDFPSLPSLFILENSR